MLLSATSHAEEMLPTSYKDMTADQISTVIDGLISAEREATNCWVYKLEEIEYLDEFLVKVQYCGPSCETALKNLNEQANTIGITFSGKKTQCVQPSIRENRAREKTPNLDLIHEIDGKVPSNQSLQRTGDD